MTKQLFYLIITFSHHLGGIQFPKHKKTCRSTKGSRTYAFGPSTIHGFATKILQIQILLSRASDQTQHHRLRNMGAHQNIPQGNSLVLTFENGHHLHKQHANFLQSDLESVNWCDTRQHKGWATKFVYSRYVLS